MRVGFLLNHYAAHQVYHCAPIAFALSSAHPAAETTIIASDADQLDLARRIGLNWPDHRCGFVLAEAPAYARMADAVLGKLVFTRKNAVLAANKELFRRLDVLVVPEKHSLSLKKDPRLADLKMVRIRHGAGDRGTGLDASNGRFDLVLASGPKMRDRLIEGGMVESRNIAMVGYPKFEAVKALPAPLPVFDNGNPTVLYNPHYKRDESSWPSMGRAVLEFFRAHRNYNLIFAPHVVLYLRRWRHGAFSLTPYANCPNIFADTGSPASLDQSYTRQADLYLGDVSSQVYEFLESPRPCVFLNPRGTAWEGNETHAHWRCGPVVERPEELGPALETAFNDRDRYLPIQKELFAYTFDMPASPAAKAADAIMTRFS